MTYCRKYKLEINNDVEEELFDRSSHTHTLTENSVADSLIDLSRKFLLTNS